MANGKYRGVIRFFQKYRNYDFPNDHLGIADRFLLNLCAVESTNEQLRELQQENPVMNRKLISAVREKMRDLGFNPPKDLHEFT